MSEGENIYETTFLAYYPDNDPGERLLIIGMIYGDQFADNIEDGNKSTWRRFITQIERTKRLYEADKNQDSLS